MRLFVDNLTNVDFSYLHSERGLVGETWLASIELEGELDEQGMICDFGIVKKMLRDWLDTELDHRLLVPTQSDALKNITEETDNIDVTWSGKQGDIHCNAPKQAITPATISEVTPESVAEWCIELLTPLFPKTVKKLLLTFTCESINGPFYHYSHGLKKHAGNCQRIAHGHRSKIEIWKNGNPDSELMSEWGKTFADIYIATNEDIVSSNDENTSFAYESIQGAFALSLPTSRCYFMETDTTVELIAKHIAGQIKQTHPNDSIKVKAYEGLSKGAIVEL